MPISTLFYIVFLGFPADIETDERDPKSRRRPERKVGTSERTYNGLHPSTRGWKPGEPRKLQSAARLNRSTGKTDVIFDASSCHSALLADFGPLSDAFSHIPKNRRSEFGFRSLSEAEYSKARKLYNATESDR